jgi:hypothetical protein
MLSMVIVTVVVLAFVMSLFSLRDYNGDASVKKIRAKHRSQKIRGTIVVKKGNKTQHYSSYSR